MDVGRGRNYEVAGWLNECGVSPSTVYLLFVWKQYYLVGGTQLVDNSESVTSRAVRMSHSRLASSLENVTYLIVSGRYWSVKGIESPSRAVRMSHSCVTLKFRLIASDPTYVLSQRPLSIPAEIYCRPTLLEGK